jgi:anti-sigma regulatory factor (Ser/Thr protein kinase)
MEMNETYNDSLRLEIRSSETFLPIAAGFAENAAQALGLHTRESLAVRLAAEEIFIHLCRHLKSDNRVEITCAWGGYFVELSFRFRERIPLHAFNLTTSISLDDERSLDDMGLLLASRSVDRFEIREETGGLIRLSVVKEKIYPPAPEEPLPPLDAFDSYAVRAPDAEALKIFARRVTGGHPSHLIPGFFSYPGKVVDMVLRGDFQVLLAVDAAEQVVGGIMWHPADPKLIEFFGPYRFMSESHPGLMEELTESFIGAVGKSEAVGVYCRLPAKSTPAAYFEELGTFDIYEDEEKHLSIPVFFRQIHEDPGATVWCHPDLEGFLSAAYERHFLPRHIRRVQEMGEALEANAVFSTRMERFQKIAVMRPMQLGRDVGRNLADHLKLFSRESFRNVLFQLDLGVSWQAHLVPDLLQNGFVPRVVVPYGGESDLVIFQWDGCRDE